MGWKTWPYWLKGGIILLAISVIYNLIAYFLALSNLVGGVSNLGEFMILFQAIIVGIPLMLLGIIDQIQYLNNSTGVIIFVVSIIISFLIGAFIGWIVGKIKSRNQ